MPSIIDKVLDVPLTNRYGRFLSGAYGIELAGRRSDHLLVYLGLGFRPLVTRINSACYTGDIFGCMRCDCHWQLEHALQLIAARRAGLLIYHLHHEGLGNGAVGKLRAHRLADAEGLSCKVAFERLGLPPDARNYTASLLIMDDLNIDHVELITNNRDKQRVIEEAGIRVASRIPARSPAPELEEFYARERADFGHDV